MSFSPPVPKFHCNCSSVNFHFNIKYKDKRYLFKTEHRSSVQVSKAWDY